MPRTRKPQTSTPSIQGRGRVANTTTSSLPQVYRFGSNKKNPSCQAPTSSVTTQSPLHVRIVGDNVYHITLDMEELANKLGDLNNLDLSNVNVTLGTVDGPVTINGNLNIEDGTLTVDEATITELTSTTGAITTLTSTDATITNIIATDVSTGTLEASGNTSIGGTLDVTGVTTLASNLNVGGDSTITGNETIGGTLDVTGATTVTDLTASSSITTVDLTATGDSTLDTVTAGATTIDSLSVTNAATVGTTLGVAGNTSVGGNLSVDGNTSVTGTSTFTGDVSTNNISSTGTASLNDVAVAGNETIAGTLSVTGNTTVNSALTVAGASTLSSNVAVGGNLSVAGNQTVTGTSTTTGNAIFNSDVTIAGDESVAGNETITGTLSVGDDVTLADDLVVNGTTSLKALETDGSVDIDGTLRVTGAINGGNGATITGQIESDIVRTGEVVADEVRVTSGLYLSNGAEAPDFILQSEKDQPNGVATLDENGKIDSSFLPPVYTTAIVKMGTGVFSNSNTAVVVDADITADSAVICTNYSDIVGDLNEVINVGQLTVVSNQTETGSFKYLIINPIE